MHYHCEIIMPPTKDIDKALTAIMSQFDENDNDEDGPSGNEFWDWYVVGGRWAGSKEMCRLDAGKLEEFYKELSKRKVTVSEIQVGKQEIKPADQIPMVDKLWNDFFPTENGEITACPVFAHSNNKYDGNDLLSCDICRVEEITDKIKCSRVIIAGPTHDNNDVEAKFMLCDNQWNGVNHMDIDWDGNVLSALKKYEEKLQNYKDEYKDKHTPKPEWICVTVDYHN